MNILLILYYNRKIKNISFRNVYNYETCKYTEIRNDRAYKEFNKPGLPKRLYNRKL